MSLTENIGQTVMMSLAVGPGGINIGTLDLLIICAAIILLVAVLKGPADMLLQALKLYFQNRQANGLILTLLFAAFVILILCVVTGYAHMDQILDFIESIWGTYNNEGAPPAPATQLPATD